MKKDHPSGDTRQGLATNTNVISIFEHQARKTAPNPIIRLAPELDGIEMLYGNNTNPNKLYSLKIACWALRAEGSVHGMVPWLSNLLPCTNIDDPLDGQWQGYRNPNSNEVFFDAPSHKIQELQSAAQYFCPEGANHITEQVVPDSIGTHAALSPNGFKTLTLVEIHSWQLNSDGGVSGLVVDYDQAQYSPVLPGDKSLKPVQAQEDFKYFFQHRMANRIKSQDPEAIAAISSLIEA